MDRAQILKPSPQMGATSPQPGAHHGAHHGTYNAAKHAATNPKHGTHAGTSHAATDPQNSVSPAHFRPGFIPTLEGLRAVAAFGIIVTHVAFQTGADSGSWWERILGRCDFFVPVFFALSGFLLWRRHRDEPSWPSYFVKRIGRIMPAYWVCLAIVVLIIPVGHIIGAPDPSSGGLGSTRGSLGSQLLAVAASVFLLQNYLPDALLSGLTHLWSLSVEMAFYLALPLIAMAVRWMRPGARALTLATAAVLSLGWAWFPLLPQNPGPGQVNLQIFPPAFAAWFAVGMLTAEAEEALARRAASPGAGGAGKMVRGVEKVLSFRPLWWAVAAGALVLASQPFYGPEGFVHPTAAEFCRRVVAGTVFAAAIVVPYALAPGSKVLDSPVMQALGRWSYAVFLWHVAVLSVVFPLLGVQLFTGHTGEVFCATVALVIPVAALSYTFVEEPARLAVAAWWRNRLAVTA